MPRAKSSSSAATQVAGVLRTLPPGTQLLDTARPDDENTDSLLFTDPVRTIEAWSAAEVGPALAALDAAVQEGYYVAGALQYEAGYGLEPGLFDAPPAGHHPLLWMGVYAQPMRLTPSAVAEALRALYQEQAEVGPPAFGLTREAYRRRIADAKHKIKAGEVYQINFTDAVTANVRGAPAALYARLRAAQPVPYGALINTGYEHLLSLSPELFFRREGERLWTRPMKGTVRRGRTAAEDAAHHAWLADDAKSRAENLMIVDLLRNDLSMCCTPGSVRVPALFTTEQHPSVIQMTSTVEGHLRPEISYEELFRALFPCGSITGAPKLRAMQHIRRLERGPRGAYCGAIGYVAPGDRAVFSVAIRTLSVHEGEARMGTGSGIVWDSDADAEFDECLLKARFLEDAVDSEQEPPLTLIETMRWADGEVALLERHLQRMANSAAYWGLPFTPDAFRAAVAEAAPPAGSPPHRLRVVCEARPGATRTHLAATATPHTAPPLRTVGIASTRIDPENPYRYHKTNRRAVYDRALAEAQAAGWDEPLLLNTRGQVCEGARTNVFIRQGEVLLTPPDHCGLLPGVYRAHVLATHPMAREDVLYPADIAAADAIYVCNAVRGWQAVTLQSEPVPS